MHKIPVDIAVIGGGPAGLAAAVKAKEEGLREIKNWEEYSISAFMMDLD